MMLVSIELARPGCRLAYLWMRYLQPRTYGPCRVWRPYQVQVPWTLASRRFAPAEV